MCKFPTKPASCWTLPSTLTTRKLLDSTLYDVLAARAKEGGGRTKRARETALPRCRTAACTHAHASTLRVRGHTLITVPLAPQMAHVPLRATNNGKRAAPTVRAAASRSGEDTDDDLSWRRVAEHTQPPPRSAAEPSDEGAGPSGHGSLSWTHVDDKDPEYVPVGQRASAGRCGADGERRRRGTLLKPCAAHGRVSRPAESGRA